MDTEALALVGRVVAYLEDRPAEAKQRLDAFLTGTQTLLLTTQDVVEQTGWSAGYVEKLCRRGALRHIAGKPHKFLYFHLAEDLERMTVAKKRQVSRARKSVSNG